MPSMGILSRLFGNSKATETPLPSDNHLPPPGAIEEAKSRPNGWVYEIVGSYRPNDDVPPEAIRGAWKVDGNGNIVGDFIPSPNYKPTTKT